AVVAVKWWAYPGWTWRGYLSDVKTVLSLLASVAALGFWLWRVYRMTELNDAVRAGVRQELQSERLPRVVCGLAALAAALCAALFITGERPVSDELLGYVDQSNWKHAREYLARLSKDPVRPDVLDTLMLYVTVHEQSEYDRLKESRSL